MSKNKLLPERKNIMVYAETKTIYFTYLLIFKLAFCDVANPVFSYIIKHTLRKLKCWLWNTYFRAFSIVYIENRQTEEKYVSWFNLRNCIQNYFITKPMIFSYTKIGNMCKWMFRRRHIGISNARTQTTHTHTTLTSSHATYLLWYTSEVSHVSNVSLLIRIMSSVHGPGVSFLILSKGTFNYFF